MFNLIFCLSATLTAVCKPTPALLAGLLRIAVSTNLNSEKLKYFFCRILFINVILVSLYPGTLISWYSGILVPWFPGILVSWYPGILLSWYPVILVP